MSLHKSAAHCKGIPLLNPPFLGDLGGLVAIICPDKSLKPSSRVNIQPKRECSGRKIDRNVIKLTCFPSIHIQNTQFQWPVFSLLLGLHQKKQCELFWLACASQISQNKKITTHDLHGLRLFDPFFGYHLSRYNYEVDPLQICFPKEKALGASLGRTKAYKMVLHIVCSQ